MNKLMVLCTGLMTSTSVLAHNQTDGVALQLMHFLAQHGGASSVLLCVVVACCARASFNRISD